MCSNFLIKTAKATLIIVFILLLTLFFVYSFKVLLLILGGALIALFFDSIATNVKKILPKVEKKTVIFLTLFVFIFFLGMLLYSFYPRVSEQIIALKKELPEAVSSIKKTIESNEVLNSILEITIKSFKSKSVSNNIQFFFSSIFGFLGDIYIMLTLAVFFLIQPTIYKEGIAKLFVPNKREEVLKTINSMGSILNKWLVGKIISMLLVGVLTGIGLYLLNIPLALSLAIIATFLAFIPNVGPIIALIPALLIAFVKGEEYVFYTFLLYVVIQIVESNIITPLIQREAISLPMALILIAQVILGLFTGYLGLILATPIMAVLLFLIDNIYIKKYLENKN